MHYTPDDYNHYDALKIPLALSVVLVYLNKYFILFLIPRLQIGDDIGYLNDVDFTRPDFGLLIAGSPALAVIIVGLVRRVPDAADIYRWIWQNGKTFLLIASSIELLLLTVYALIGRRDINEILALFIYLDVMIMVYLVKSNRIVDVFDSFPKAQPETATKKTRNTPIDALESRKKLIAMNKAKISNCTSRRTKTSGT